MNFSPDKCEVQLIGLVKKLLVTSYFLNEHELKKVDEHKHLGITITSTLNWSAHIETMAAKARKVWGIIKRTTRGTKMTAGLQLYKSLVVPILEYASPVWNPIKVKDSMRLELIQRQATKFIAGPEMDYISRLIFLHLESLESCHHVKDLTTCYKYLNGFIDVNTHRFTPSLSSRTRSQHNQKLQLHFCRINSYKLPF